MRFTLTQWNASKADNKLNGAKYSEDRFRLGAIFLEPLKGLVGERKAEQVLEDDHAGECLDSQSPLESFTLASKPITKHT